MKWCGSEVVERWSSAVVVATTCIGAPCTSRPVAKRTPVRECPRHQSKRPADGVAFADFGFEAELDATVARAFWTSGAHAESVAAPSAACMSDARRWRSASPRAEL